MYIEFCKWEEVSYVTIDITYKKEFNDFPPLTLGSKEF